MSNRKRIALLGQPNSGKSTVFNALTGMHQHVGNWPGKTVEKKTGTFEKNGIFYEVADLPGSYALSANSEEEIVTRDYIAQKELDLVCILADGSQLERSLYMLADYVGIKTPAMLVITMTDVADKQGKKINTDKLSERLGIPVIGIVAPHVDKNDTFYQVLEQAVLNPKTIRQEQLYQYYEDGAKKELYQRAVVLAENITDSTHSKEWIAGKLLEKDEAILRDYCKNIKDLENITEEDGNLYTSDCKFLWIESLMEDCIVKEKDSTQVLTKFDRIAISSKWGKPFAVLIMILTFAGSMILATPITLIGTSLSGLLNPVIQSFLSSVGVSQFMISFVQAAVVTALGWAISMVGFVFGVNFVFGLVEESGYAARVSYIFDGTMTKLGLQGKSIMPMMLGLGCTIGGATGARVVDSWGQKILTIALVWAVPCAATFAVIPSLATAFFGTAGILVMLLIFIIMLFHVFITAKIFGRKLNPVEERTGIIMELPPLHRPRILFVLKQSFVRVWEIFYRALSIEIVVCALFFLLSYSPNGIEGSILYRIGILIEPVTKFFGMGWQTFMSFTASMVAKEAVLGVLSAILVNSGAAFDSVAWTAAADANVGTLATEIIDKAQALAFMIAVTFNIPCLQAVVATYQESRSLKWTLRIGLYYIVTALLLSCVVYHIAVIIL